ncbi:MAG TPA: apolipoprotein N-acyltransferase [Candidatus Krumholzibacteria bacterium]|nr:apolipoprotein N-acyltransferase [Candidatus Krumholzibacteria bacterium]HPD71272.1 apolipoprotein N-acyltransferase [Candidatus Krumholzibacteria bacterium]HRY39028.1 apolipoprotein N-acyltransferase [Candidatus Krumholzibacteria bacterium]
MNDRIRDLPEAPRWRPSLVTVAGLLAGVMLTSAMPPFRGTAVLAPLALAILFDGLRRTPRPARLAFFFGVSHQATLLVWLFFLDPAKSIPTRALVPVQAIAAILFVAAHYWLLGVVAGQVRRWTGPRFTLMVLPLLWVGLELLRSAGELGFPWCLVGAAWLETPLRPLYAACGEIGLGGATALLGAALVAVADLLRDGRRAGAHRWGVIAACGVLWLGLWAASAPLGSAPAEGQRTAPLTVASVQANVAQADKWDDARIDSTRIPYTTLTAGAAERGAELVVWAETAVPSYLRYDGVLLEWVRTTASDNRTAILAGYLDARLVPGSDDPAAKPRYERFNTAGLFSDRGTLVATYGKHHLVPLGEAMPFQRWLPALGRIDVGQAEWTAGLPPGPMLLPTSRGEVPLVPLICFEAAFSQLARRAVGRGGGVLVNITNDGWFGHRAGPIQHAALSRIRAVECGVPLVRSANNGISLICDADGEVRARLGLHRRGAIHAEIATVARGTRYVRTGWWPVVAYLGLWGAAAAVLVRRDAAQAGKANA